MGGCAARRCGWRGGTGGGTRIGASGRGWRSRSDALSYSSPLSSSRSWPSLPAPRRSSTGRITAAARSGAPTSTARAWTRASSHGGSVPLRGGRRRRARLLGKQRSQQDRTRQPRRDGCRPELHRTGATSPLRGGGRRRARLLGVQSCRRLDQQLRAIGRAKLDGTRTWTMSFISLSAHIGEPPAAGWRSTPLTCIGRTTGRSNAIGRADLDGTVVDPSFITVDDAVATVRAAWRSTASTSTGPTGH